MHRKGATSLLFSCLFLSPFSGGGAALPPPVFPQGTFVLFQSPRPAMPLTVRPKEDEPIPGVVSNLWRVDRVGSGWSKAVRLPDAVNIGHSIWKPSIAAN